MKKLLIALAAVLVTAASYGQGTIYFNTRVVGVVDAPVLLANGNSPGPDYSAQLFLVGAGGSLTPLTPATTFRSGSAVAQTYVTPVDQVVVPGVNTGGSASIAMGAWPTSAGSFDAAKAAGLGALSATVTVDNLGGGVLPPANLVGAAGALKGFTIPVPEPSVIALGVLGASALFLRRRK
jgi:hypothetical protein